MKKLPKFKSAKEEREFWETHEALDYFDPKGFVPLAPLVKGVKLSHIYVAPDGSRWELRKLRPKRTVEDMTMRSEGAATQGSSTRIDFHETPWIQVPTSSVLGEQPADSTKYFGAPPLFERPMIQPSQLTVTEQTR